MNIISLNHLLHSFCSFILKPRDSSRRSIVMRTSLRFAMAASTLALGTLAILVSMTAMSGSAHAVNLVSNGSFEQTTCGYSCQIDNSDLTNWTTTSGFAFLVYPGQASISIDGGTYRLWPGANCPPTCFPATSPDGGNFIAHDGAYLTGAEMQTITGLQVGHSYNVSFWQAAGQAYPYSGDTTEEWQVSLGSDTQYSHLMHNLSHDFVPWEQETLTFQANSTSEVLSFFAVGTPNGVPPFVLLDGVTIDEVPEPGSLCLLGTAAIGISGLVRRRFLSSKVAGTDANH